MNFNDFSRLYKLKEVKSNEKDNFIAKKILTEYMEKRDLLRPVTSNYIEDLIYNYFLVKNTNDGDLLESIMKKYNFSYAMSVRNSLYYLLGKEEELFPLDVNPLLYPGVDDIEKVGSIYTLNTNLGKIQVQKASELFENTNSSYIFDRQLMGKCHARSYDFVKENSDKYQIILSYMNNFFNGGYYHTYLENDTSILDISANCYYLSKKDGSKILNGDIIRKLDYTEAERCYRTFARRMPELRGKGKSKLLTLALYYDYKRK